MCVAAGPSYVGIKRVPEVATLDALIIRFMLANVKTNVGPCWRSLIPKRVDRGFPYAPHVLEALIKEHNIGITETRAA